MSRSIWKGPFVEYHDLLKILPVQKNSSLEKAHIFSSSSLQRDIFTKKIAGQSRVPTMFARRTVILPQFIELGLTFFQVHNGRKFVNVPFLGQANSNTQKDTRNNTVLTSRNKKLEEKDFILRSGMFGKKFGEFVPTRQPLRLSNQNGNKKKVQNKEKIVTTTRIKKNK